MNGHYMVSILKNGKKIKLKSSFQEREFSRTISDRGDDKYILDWQPYLNDGKRKVSR